jgi:hypothetical protein
LVFTRLPERLLSPSHGSSTLRADINDLSKGHAFLIEAKRLSASDSGLAPSVPAVGQAIAWATVMGFVMSQVFFEMWLLN